MSTILERASARFLPMRAAGTQHQIERTYRESGVLQWVRETAVNAKEAGATRILFGVEWQAVENQGVYRRLIADNGCGMTAEELVGFFNTYGGGGKPIGGLHENFGVGSKTSLLPWNHYGMVVVSWVDGIPSMIWVTKDPETGEYGLQLVEAEDEETGDISLDEVYYPYGDDEHGCNWAAIKPDWIEDNGTVIVLLGNTPDQNTVLGDPTREEESDIKALSTYLNRRMWKLDGLQVQVDELRTNDQNKWPRSAAEAYGPIPPKPKPDRRTNTRTIEGAEYYITYPRDKFTGGKLAASGTVPLRDGTKIDWYLWSGERPAVQSYAAIGGYIAALYSDELYDITTHHSTYRSFGISEASVRKNVTLIMRPPMAADGRHGVYPRTDRNGLLLQYGPNAGEPLPINDWAGEFNDLMPQELLDAIRKARGGRVGSLDDTTWRNRIAERFGARWKIFKLRIRSGGSQSVTPGQPGSRPVRTKKAAVRRRRKARPGTGGRGGSQNIGTAGSVKRAERVKVAGGIPRYRAVNREELAEGMLAAWQPNDPEFPEGVVLINVDHPVLREEVEHWQGQYADHHAEDIENDVVEVYGQMAVAKVAHSEHLKGILPSATIESTLRSEGALTMALLGLMGEEAVIAPRLGGKYKKKRSVA